MNVPGWKRDCRLVPLHARRIARRKIKRAVCRVNRRRIRWMLRHGEACPPLFVVRLVGSEIV